MAMSVLEMNMEVLECARYGEFDDLRALLVAGADVNYADDSGNTGLHKAAANGEVECLRVLKEFGALHVANSSGNFPIHWAAQNAKVEALRILFESYDVDVLTRNNAGRSTLTDAFDSKNTDVIEICLSHSSASEERLIETTDKNAKVVMEEEDTENSKESAKPSVTYDVTKDAVSHQMQFLAYSRIVHIRELPITRADHPFGSEAAPQDDTTGLGIWPASIILSRWAARYGPDLFNNKVVVELGAGCGLPAIATALLCHPSKVYVTDIHEPTLDNALYNVQLNAKSEDVSKDGAVYRHTANADLNSSTQVIVSNVNWKDVTTFPKEKADVILGSDLVYDSAILSILVPAVDQMLSLDGCLLYCAPITGRDGMSDLIEALAAVKIVCSEMTPVPSEFYENPLRGVDEDYFVLHFYDLCAKQPHTLYKFVRG